MSLTILACDSSKNQTGFCVATIHDMKTGVEVVYSTGTFKAKGDTDAEVLLNWGHWWSELVRLYHPDLIVFEIPVIAQLNNMVLYQITGILQYIAADRSVKILPVNGSTLRSWHGAAKKPVAEARGLLGLEPDAKLSDDESDAAFLSAIGVAYLQSLDDVWPEDPKHNAIIARLRLSKAEKASAASAAKIAAGQKEQARQDTKKQAEFDKYLRERKREVAKQERERAQEARRVARELRAAETERKRTDAAQKRAEREAKKSYIRLEEMR